MKPWARMPRSEAPAFTPGYLRRAILVGAVGLAVAGCVPRTPKTVSLRVAGNVPDASVTIDDEYVGSLAYVASRGVALPPGTHRVTVEKVGYFPWDRIVEARREPIRLEVALTPVPD